MSPLIRAVGLILAIGLIGQAGLAAAMPGVDIPSKERPQRGPPPPEIKKHSVGLEDTAVDYRVHARVFGTLTFVFGVVFVVLLVVYKTQVRELELPANERDLASVMAVRGMGVSPREAAYRAILTSGKWVTPGRVALSSGLSPAEAEELLAELLAEGRIKSGQDEQGRKLYKVS